MNINTGGRPTIFNIEIVAKICDMLTTTDRGLNDICKDDDMPSKSTVWRWLSSYPDFWDIYTKAAMLSYGGPRLFLGIESSNHKYHIMTRITNNHDLCHNY